MYSGKDFISGAERYTLDHYKTEALDKLGRQSYDWQDAIYRTAFVQNYNISLSGGSKEAGNRYNASVSVTDQDGVIVQSNFQRYQGKLNFQQKIGKKVTFDLLANYSRSTHRQHQAGLSTLFGDTALSLRFLFQKEQLRQQTMQITTVSILV